MGRCIYEVKLKQRYFPAFSKEEALRLRNQDDNATLTENDDVEIDVIVPEYEAMKLFVLAKIMQDNNFDCQEVYEAVEALCKRMGYIQNRAEIAVCVADWVERFDMMTLEELKEWMMEAIQE